MVVGRIVTLRKKGSIIYMALRTEQGKIYVKVKDFRPYFYVPSPNGMYIGIDGTRLEKIYVDDPSKIPEERAKYNKHYEADIPYTRRFLIDTGLRKCVNVNGIEVSYRDVKPIHCTIPLRIWYIDIEVLSHSIPSPSNPDKPVVAVTVYDSYKSKYVTFVVSNTENIVSDGNWIKVYCLSEKKLFELLLNMIKMQDPDVVVGWNVKFDVDYLEARSKVVGIPIMFQNAEVFDLLYAFKELHRRSSYRLKSIAREEGILIEGLPETFSPSMDVETLAKYNWADVYYMVKLDEKYKVTEFYIELKETVGLAHIDDALTPTVLIDTELLRLAKEKGVVLPSKPERYVETNYEGAIVFNPPKGVYEGVAVFDMATYYPSIIISFNISPDTFDQKGRIKYSTTGVSFTDEKVGLVPELCKRFLNTRKRLDKELEKLTPGSPEYVSTKLRRDAVKYLVNAIYGYFAFENSRVFNVKLAETVTAIGREGLLKAKEIIESVGYKVLYGDTDSIMVQVPFEKVEEVVQKLNHELSKYFKEKYNLKECQIKLKSELYADRVLFFGVKKRYAMHVVYEKGRKCDYIKVVGLEAVRTDQSRFSKEFQKKLIEMVLKGSPPNDVLDFVKKSAEEMKNRPLIDIALVKGIDKPLHQYKTKPPHVRAAIWSNLHLGTNFKHGDRVYFLWVNMPSTDVIGFDEETVSKLNGVQVDWKKMEELNIWSKAEPILDALSITKNKQIVGWLK
ncbi:MAG: DNA-directed DNA polymerase [Archaeoglobaceae archaeon]